MPPSPSPTYIHLFAVAACATGCVVDDFEVRYTDLEPVADYREDDFIARSRPEHVELSADGSILFVTLSGNLIAPASELLALDAGSGEVLARLEVGRSPKGMALGPGGAYLYVANQLSDALTVVDVEALEVAGSIPVSFYAQDLALSDDGRALYVTNRWLDAVEEVTLTSPVRGSVTRTFAVGTNPRDIVVGPDGLLYVGNLSATSISRVDLDSGREVDRLYTNSPINGLASDGERVFAATLGRGDGHPAAHGVNDSGAHYRGDTTASLGFADINNDVMVIDPDGVQMRVIRRYTSDTAEVSHADAVGDYTPGEMIVYGALPEQMAVRGSRLFVTMSASDSVQVFDIGADGSLHPAAVLHTGINPFEIAVSPDGQTVYTADRLGETISVIAVADNRRTSWWVGASDRPYPANRYEQGEMLFHSARFSSEALPSEVFPDGDRAGDKSCNHCHRETLTDGKVWSVGIGLLVPLGGQRMPPAARNIRDTEPLFWEGVQTRRDFDLETNEFAPPADFGCDTHETEAHPETCAAREAFFMSKVGHNFLEVGTELLGEFLAGRPRLVPNPLAQHPTPEARDAIARGEQLFHTAGCFGCHPGNGTSTVPFTNNQNMPPVITPSPLDVGLRFKHEVEGHFNVPSLRGVWDRPTVYFHDGRAKSLRSAIVGPNHTALRPGIDGCQMLADNADLFIGGIVQPVANARGCNELSSAADSHGATSELTAEQIADLETFVLSIQ
jgi:YVTN family beta-propeller protein